MSKGLRTIDGVEVRNAPYDWGLKITEKMAKEGLPMDIEQCPGALGCMQFPGAIKAKVFKSRIYILVDVNGEVMWFMFIVPRALMVQEAVIDRGGRFQAGTYIIKAPKGGKRVGQGEQGTKTRPPKDPNAPKRSKPFVTEMRINAPTAST